MPLYVPVSKPQIGPKAVHKNYFKRYVDVHVPHLANEGLDLAEYHTSETDNGDDNTQDAYIKHLIILKVPTGYHSSGVDLSTPTESK
ncbi:MAG: hypothetical protein GY816_11930 [Cytophagales bacterium]|nr:hypothetical protein [Cytophagales bacterium]